MCDAHEAVKRARHDQGAISVEVYGGDKVEMAVQCLDAFTCIELSIRGHKSLDNTRTFRCIPYSHITVTTSGYKLCPLGVVVDTEYIACMSFEHFTRQTLPATVEHREHSCIQISTYRIDIPYSNGVVIRCCGEVDAVRRPCNIRQALCVPIQITNKLPGER